MLWDIIRDWFVMYVFGGIASNGEGYFPSAGQGYVFDGTNSAQSVFGDGFDMTTILYKVGQDGFTPDVRYDVYISAADWLSTTATIITLIALCLFLFLAVKWVFNVFRNTLERVGK